MFWFLFSIIVVLCSYLGEKEWRYKYVFRIFLVLALSYVIGFGCVVSRDHYIYENYYLSINNLSFIGTLFSNISLHNNDMEFGWYLINLFFNKLHFGPAAFFFIIALITNSLFVSVFYRYRMVWLGMIYFIVSIYFNQEMNVVRQMLAVAIFLFSLRFLEHKDYLKYFLCIFLCMTIHTSSVFLVFVALWGVLKKTEINKIGYYLIFALWLISFANAIGIIHVYIPFIPIISYYDNYDITENGVGTAGVIDSVYNGITLLYFLLYNSKKNLNLYSVVFLIGIIIMNFSVSMPPLYRFGLYFAPISCCLIGEILSNINAKMQTFKVPILLIILFYFILRIWNGYIANPNMIVGESWYSISDIFLK